MKVGISSFRVRIFLVSLLAVGLILATIAALGWTSALSYEVDRLDTRLCEEAHQLVSRPPPPDGLGRIERDAAVKLRLQSADELLLWLQPASSETAIHSSRWPQGLNLSSLAWSAAPNRRPQSGVAEGPAPGDGPPRPLCQVAGFSLLSSDWRAAKLHESSATGLVAADLGATRTELRQALISVAWRAAPLALVLTALGAWLVSTLAMRPVTRLRSTMEAVNQMSLEHRLSVGREDREFKALIDTYNRMLDRLEASFCQATRFSADAAHELRTPLTILQGQIEQAMRVSGDQPIQVQLSQMLDEAGRLSSITRKLLLLSQADTGQLALWRTPVDLGLMLEERLADAQLLELQNVRVSSELDAHVFVQGDTQLLAQVLNNLCGNAYKYTPPGGWIRVSARTLTSGVEMLWCNSTLAIAPQARERWFDRFFRGDVAHNRKIDGHGLGLSLSRVIARAHGGELTLEPSPNDEVRLRLWLPTA